MPQPMGAVQLYAQTLKIVREVMLCTFSTLPGGDPNFEGDSTWMNAGKLLSLAKQQITQCHLVWSQTAHHCAVCIPFCDLGSLAGLFLTLVLTFHHRE